jgi:single-strand DNA-binding protein
MSDGMNRVILMGNLGADPELRFAGTGTAVLQFRMATNESYVDRNREVQERTEWHSVVVFGPRAEGLSRVLVKGSGVLIEGTLRTSSYEKDGQKRYKTEVHARELCLTGGPPSSARSASAAPPRDMDDEVAPDAMPMPLDEPPSGIERPERPRAARRKNGGTSRQTGVLDELPF